MSPAPDAVRVSTTVPVEPERAFAVFADELATWWPPEFTWSQEQLQTIAIEAREGGSCYELGPYGFRIDWGRVLACERPARLLLSWQIGPTRVPEPDPARASEVEVRFEPEGDSSTRVEIDHRGFARHGEAGEGYRDAMEGGWAHLAERYAATLA